MGNIPTREEAKRRSLQCREESYDQFKNECITRIKNNIDKGLTSAFILDMHGWHYEILAIELRSLGYDVITDSSLLGHTVSIFWE